MMSVKKTLGKEEIDKYLKIFANKYRKYNKNSPAEIIIVGGSSIVMNYGFRESTADIDAIIDANSVYKDIVLEISEEYGLEKDWMNTDFKFFNSYSPKLKEVSKYYNSYNNGLLTIRTVEAEYLIAMKMVSARTFGNDIADIIGILLSENRSGNIIDENKILCAINKLYGDMHRVSDYIKNKVSAFCKMDVTELEKCYADETQNAKDIKKEIIEANNEGEISLNRTTAKEVAMKILSNKTKNEH